MTTAPQVVVVANAEDHDPASDPWAVLEVGLTALARFAPDVEVVVGWAAAHPPQPAGERQTAVEVPPASSDWQARAHLLQHHVQSDVVVLLSADAIVGPATIPSLVADHGRALADGRPVGFVVAGSDRAFAPQVVRPGETGPAELPSLPRIELTAAAIRRDVLLAVPAPLDDLLGDAIVSWELGLSGFEHLLGSGYVHRVGPATPSTWGDGSGSVPAELTERLRLFRPDLLEALTPPTVAAGAPTPPEEEADPVTSALRWRRAGDSPRHRVGTARCLRSQGRTIEAVEALGDFEVHDLDDHEASFVVELAWLVGDRAAAIEVASSRPALARTASELRVLDEDYLAIIDKVARGGFHPTSLPVP